MTWQYKYWATLNPYCDPFGALTFFFMGLYLFCFLFSCVVTAKSIERKSCKNISHILLFIYFAITFYSTVLDRNVSDHYQYHLIPFWSYFSINDTNAMMGQILLNMLLFIPVGNLAHVSFKKNNLKRALLIAGIFSLTIELSQLIFRTGMFEFDDIIHNVLGCFAGYMLIELIGRIVNKKQV